MAQSLASLRINVGPQASFEALASILSDLQTVLDFAQGAQAVIDRNDAAYSVLRQRDYGALLDDFDIAPGYARSEFLAFLISSGTPFVRSVQFERAVEERLTARQLDRTVRVESLRYANPLDINLNFDGGGIARILEIIRDWSARRQEARANARRAEAEARQAEAIANAYEEELEFRRQLQNAVRGALLTDGLRIGSDDVTHLLTEEVQGGLERLIRADTQVEIHPVADDSAAQ